MLRLMVVAEEKFAALKREKRRRGVVGMLPRCRQNGSAVPFLGSRGKVFMSLRKALLRKRAGAFSF